MAAIKGRSLSIKKNNVTIAKVRTKTVTVNNEPIDITNDDDNGFRTLLADPATRSIELSVEGVMDGATFRAIAAGATATDNMLTDITIAWPSGSIAGNFYLASYAETGAHNDAVTFTMTLQSSGAFTYTA